MDSMSTEVTQHEFLSAITTKFPRGTGMKISSLLEDILANDVSMDLTIECRHPNLLKSAVSPFNKGLKPMLVTTELSLRYKKDGSVRLKLFEKRECSLLHLVGVSSGSKD